MSQNAFYFSYRDKITCLKSQIAKTQSNKPIRQIKFDKNLIFLLKRLIISHKYELDGDSFCSRGTQTTHCLQILVRTLRHDH